MTFSFLLAEGSEMENVIVRLRDMPNGIRGVTVLDSDGDYNVYINSRLTGQIQRIAYVHELRHIRRGDFHSERSIDSLEPEIFGSLADELR